MLMDILFKSLHNLDLESDEPVSKEIHADFESYLQEYIAFSTTENDTKRDYTLRDENTTVVRCVADIISGVIAGLEDLGSLSDSIARKLLFVEKDVQEDVLRLGIQVQKGSVIQALIEDDDGYKYIIAKVEHSEFFEVENYRRDIGFPSENKRVWKSAVISWRSIDGELSFAGARVYAKSGEHYWTNSFLEMDPANEDEKNTQIVYAEINRVLNSKVKEQSPADYTKLQNAVIATLQSERQINYPEMIQNIFGSYQPTDETLKMEPIIEKLQALQNAGKFDTQFNSYPKAVKNIKKRKYQISTNIELILHEGIDNLSKNVQSITTSEGDKYIQVLCENEKVFRAFLTK